MSMIGFMYSLSLRERGEESLTADRFQLMSQTFDLETSRDFKFSQKTAKSGPSFIIHTDPNYLTLIINIASESMSRFSASAFGWLFYGT